MLRRWCEIVLVLLLAAGVAMAEPVATAERDSYGLLYTAWVKEGQPWVKVRVRISRHPEWIRWIRLTADPTRYRNLKGNGTLTREGSDVTWVPPAEDAWFQYEVDLRSKRSNGRFDGMVTQDWILFRADDLVPVVRVDMQDGTQARAKLSLDLPKGWSAATRYPRYASGRYKIDDPGWFDRPIGWMLIGKFGARRETIGQTRVNVAAPVGQDVHRLDILAFLRWTLPEVQKIFPGFPDRLLVVGAGDPMWRGALSGPASLFVHADRPMISENGTSTYVHELIHVAMRARSRPGSDWIVEGLAEYYSLEVLRRSGTLSQKRFDAAHAALATWGKEAPTLDVPSSSGPVTAKAVGVLREIDAQIRKDSGGARSLDDVARALAEEGKAVTRERFDELVAAARTAKP